MMLRVDPAQLTAIRRHGEADYPHEACGLIGGLVEADGKRVVELLPLPNARQESRQSRYLINPDVFRSAERRLGRNGLGVVGVYHSHPDHPARPSDYDREHAWPWLSYVIVSVSGGRADDVRSWVLSDDRETFAEELIWQSPS